MMSEIRLKKVPVLKVHMSPVTVCLRFLLSAAVLTHPTSCVHLADHENGLIYNAQRGLRIDHIKTLCKADSGAPHESLLIPSSISFLCSFVAQRLLDLKGSHAANIYLPSRY